MAIVIFRYQPNKLLVIFVNIYHSVDVSEQPCDSYVVFLSALLVCISCTILYLSVPLL